MANSKAIEHFKYSSTENICDSLFESLRLSLPEVSRTESENWCVFRSTADAPGLAYVDHQKARLKIYLRTNETDESEWQAVASAHGVSLEKRKTIKRPWESRTPFFFFIDSMTTQAGSVLLLKAAGIEVSAPSAFVEYPSEINARAFEEGGRRTVTVNTYERDPAARQECIRFFGCRCTVCGFDFKASYGDIGDGFIHVHHLIPVAQIGKRYQVVPNRDMCPVCPNCHEMLHTKTPPFTIEEMRDILRSTGRLKV